MKLHVHMFQEGYLEGKGQRFQVISKLQAHRHHSPTFLKNYTNSLHLPAART